MFVENLRERLIDEGVIDKVELDERLQELRRHIDDPNTLVVSNTFFQVWGRRPEQ